MSSFGLAYRTPFIAAIIGIAVLASVWVIYEQVREPVISILICPEGTENNGNNICLCSDPHTVTVRIDGIISCFPTVPEPDAPDVCDLVPDHPKCERAPKIPLDMKLEIPSTDCEFQPNPEECRILKRANCADKDDCE